MSYIKVLLLSLLSFNGLAFAEYESEDLAIPFEMINGLIIVQTQIDKSMGNYIFDTGAEELIINKSVNDGSVLFSSISGDLATEEVKIDLLTIGNVKHNNIKAYAADLASMESYLNISLQGVIGGNLLTPRKIKIDFLANQIILSSTDDLIIGRDNYVNFEMQDNVPVCAVKIEGKDYYFGFDTGATMHVFDQKLSSRLPNCFRDTGLETYVSTGAGNKTIHKIMSLEDMNFGVLNLENTHFLLQDLTAFNTSMKKPIAGVLSLVALEYDDFIIDFQTKRIYF